MGRTPKIRTSSLGLFVSQLRAKLGYSVTSLADAAGVSASTVSDLERGERQLKGKIARKLAGPLGVTPNELLIAAGLTPEFSWEKTIAATGEPIQELKLIVSAEEGLKIREYLGFLRFQSFSSKTQDNSGA